MASKTVLDTFLNFAVGRVSPASNVAGSAVQKLETGLTNIQKVAWEVYRIEYMLYGAWALGTHLAAQQDYISFGWTQNSDVLNVPYGLLSASLIDTMQMRMTFSPAAIGLELRDFPMIHDFGQNPRLVLPQTLYVALDWQTSVAMVTTDILTSRIWYRERELSSEDWYDLLQLRLPLGVIA
jgi:hypothetical protein